MKGEKTRETLFSCSMFIADEKIKKAGTIRNDCKMMVPSAEDLIAKEEHYHATFYCSYISVNYNKENDEARVQEDAKNDDQNTFEFAKHRLKQIYQKPDIIVLTTVSDLYAEKLKDNQAEDIRVSYLKKNLKSMWSKIDDVIQKQMQLKKEFDRVIKCNE